MTILAARDSMRTVFYVRFKDGSTNWLHRDHMSNVSMEELASVPLYREWAYGSYVPRPRQQDDMEDFWGYGG